MDLLIPHNQETHVGTEIVAKKKLEYKFLGTAIRRKGQTLWGLNAETLEVYEIKLVKKDLLDLKGRQFGKYKAHLKSSDPMLWSLNRKNAVRKFKLAAHESKRDRIE